MVRVRRRLSDFATTASGGTPSREHQEYFEGSIRWVTTSELRDTCIVDTMEHISEDAIINSSAKVFPANTLLMAMYGATIGRLGIITKEAATNQACCAIFPDNTMDMKYIFYCLLYDRKCIVDKGCGAGQPNISQKIIKNIEIPYCDINEQREIARALTDIDNLIEYLEKLIKKKKAIKQGVMQELLTGKKRLSRFSGEWFNVNMSKNSKIKARIGWQGLTTAEYLDTGYSFLITGTDFANGRINWSGCHYVTKERFDQDSNIQIRNDDILITKDGTIGKIAKVVGLTQPATLNSGVFVVRPTTKVFTSGFLFHVLMSNIFKKFIKELTAGSTIVHLYQKDIVKFSFFVPPTIEEQNAITEIIDDMDVEINGLSKKLEKYRQIKQGMMQKLLTGEIRLV